MGQCHNVSGHNAGSTNLDNSKLLELLDIYQKQQGEGDSYRNVITELLNGNSFLLLTSQNNNANAGEWTTTKEESTMNLTCVHTMDGLKVLAAFTDEDSLLGWTKQPTQYTALAAKDVLKLGEDNLIDRIVINGDLPTMFILERRRENIETETMGEGTTVHVGAPSHPLGENTVQRLKEQFQKIGNIDEVYQYGQAKNNEFSLVLGFKLLTSSEHAKTAAINAVETAFQGETSGQPVDIFFIESDEWYQTISDIENSLLYRK